MLTHDTFTHRFGRKALFGMIHLRPLPGSPLYGGSMDAVIEHALADARALAGGGCDGVIVENFGDKPFRKERVEGECVAAMTRVVAEVRRTVALPVGVNVLRNDALSAIAIASATGAAFIRVNVHVGAMLTDQGIIEGDAAETVRRRGIVAPDVGIFADHMVKHAVPLAPVDQLQSAKDLRLRGLADAVIVTGAETGAACEPDSLRSLREVLADTPLIVGSGLTAENAASFAEADAAIAGTSIKREGRVDEPVDRDRVERLVQAFKAVRQPGAR